MSRLGDDFLDAHACPPALVGSQYCSTIQPIPDVRVPTEAPVSLVHEALHAVEGFMSGILGNAGAKPISTPPGTAGNYTAPPQSSGSPPLAPKKPGGGPFNLLGPMSTTEKIILGGAAAGIGYLLYRKFKKGR